uniref:Uncharacterized protein n=1 Tax=Panagrolaimus sp. ES5 TaxID=591445 RepID=A0AC34F1X5_9BILA
MESRLNKRSLCERFPHCQFFDYEDSKNWAKAALIKADILKKNSWFNSFDARNVLVHKYDLMMGETYIGFNTGSYNYSLPKRFVLHFGEVSLKDMDVGELEALEKHRIDSESYHKKSADNLKITVSFMF